MLSKQVVLLCFLLSFYEVSCSKNKKIDSESSISSESSETIESSEETSEYQSTSTESETNSGKPKDAFAALNQWRELREVDPEVKNIGDDFVSAAESLRLRIADRIKIFQTRIQCVMDKVEAGQEVATEGIKDVGECMINSGKKTNQDLFPIFQSFDGEVRRTVDLIQKVASDLFECRKSEKYLPCARMTLKLAEKELSSIGRAVGKHFQDVGKTWNNLRMDIQQCFVMGAGQATVFERQMRDNIMQCLKS